MFTGIITGQGVVREITPSGVASDMRLVITSGWVAPDITIGASIACSGCCLTVTELGPDWFAATVSGETLSKTTLGDWRVGSPMNLERALRVGDELGGHIVAGHVDGVATVISLASEAASTRWVFAVPDLLARYIAPKGSIAVDGVSLTVNEVDGPRFGVNIIPHTAAVTSFGLLRPGHRVNIEIDTVARYVARLQEYA